MKFALIGEYSGFHLELARGLEKLGHIVHVYADGDNFKNIESTHSWILQSKNYLELARNIFLYQPRYLKKILNEYDVVQFINPGVITAPNNFNRLYISYLSRVIKSSKAIKILAVVGCDSRVQPVLDKLKTSPCKGCLVDLNRSKCHFAETNQVNLSKMFEEQVDLIIPFGSQAYASSYSHSVKNIPPIMFPIDIDKIVYQPNILANDKIVVLHGLNRPGFKGTRKISAVFSKIDELYPGKFEFLLPDRLPFADYLKLLSQANIIVDQMHVDTLAMNSLYSLASGRVLMTCHEKNTNVGSVNLKDSPAINFNDEHSLKLALINILNWSADDFIQCGILGREFVEKHCSADVIATNYLSEINKRLS